MPRKTRDHADEYARARCLVGSDGHPRGRGRCVFVRSLIGIVGRRAAACTSIDRSAVSTEGRMHPSRRAARCCLVALTIALSS